MRNAVRFLSFLLFFTVLFSACQQEGDLRYSTEGLQFSADTLSMDTVFTTLSSTTYWLRVVNTTSDDLMMDRVELTSGGQSGFRINLDGVPGTTFDRIRVPARDSLFLFVALTPPATGVNEPVLIEDAIRFTAGTHSKQVVLKAHAWDAHFMKGKHITQDTTFTSAQPIVVYDSLVVDAGACLTMLAGTQLYFHEAAFLHVNGQLKSYGTPQQPVVLRGDRLDRVLPEFPYSYYPGQWGYVRLAAESFDNEMQFTHVLGAAYGLVVDSSAQEPIKLYMQGAELHNAYFSSLYVVGGQVIADNSQFSNSGSYTALLVGGNHRFTHCTFANYQWLVSRDGPTLTLANQLLDENEQPISHPLKAHFVNCIVFGSQSSELLLALSESDQTLADVWFDHCVLKASETDLLSLSENCAFPSEVYFLKKGSSSEAYQIDYRIDSLSPARDMARRLTEPQYALDKLGNPRYNDAVPDVGSYEYIVK